jgi:carbon-monoxide dehydrogenase medium subunit
VKPPPFAYHAPATPPEALDLLRALGDGAKVLAGGQSLIPLLNMRLVAPAHLVDVNGVAGLDGIEVGPGAVRVGATVRHAQLERHADAGAACPLLAQALRLVAHPVIRNRGTVCGALAHADPAGELTAVLAVLGGTVRVEAAGAAPRDVEAGAFFLGPLESSLRPGELVTSAAFPRTPSSTGTAFAEVSRRHGDYALAGVAALVDVGDDGRIAGARVATISVSPTPLVVDLGEVLTGADPERADWAAAAARVRERAAPEGDIHASAEYRRHLVGVLTARALHEAAGRGERARRAA